MGVPSFYKWLTNKYPKIVVDALEEKGESVDATLKNPNDLEFDNLYLDMNGIIHACFHPEDSEMGPTRFEEVFENIYEYIDRIFNIVRPRKLLFMAIDGVAPRAKMNQQRTGRFRNAKDQEIWEKEEERMRKEFELEGKRVLPKAEKSEVSDSNLITPGTEFMKLLSTKLERYIESRMCVNPAWKKIKVILSNANVPGEGEHKIMSFIRAQRCSPGYDPNTRHCVYGLDADLIMLALGTHEIHFSILRENAFQYICHYIGTQDTAFARKQVIKEKPYQFLHVWILREFLELDLKITNPPEDFYEDLERLIDDFIFICFFAGNDFLPHMPTLEMHEGAMDLLVHVYQKEFKNIGGYLLDMSRVDDREGGFWKQSRVEKFILAVGSFEDQIFQKRIIIRDCTMRKILLDDAKAIDEAQERLSETFYSLKVSNTDNVWNDSPSVSRTDLCIPNNSDILKNTIEMKIKLKERRRLSADTYKNGNQIDKVRLGEDGWKKRYYKEKFTVDGPDEIEHIRKELVQKYTEGLCWVLCYYFSDVPSWSWLYPYHYGPFASDLKGLSQVKVEFDKGIPFKPFDQLMAVLPPRSAHALAGPFKQLMLDETSPIIDFYPNDFEIDAAGIRFLYKAICKLPFIEEECLLLETRKLQSVLKDHEMERNAETTEMLFVESSTPLGGFLLSLYRNGSSAKQTDAIEIDASLSRELNGSVYFNSEEFSVRGSDGSEDYKSTDVLCAFFNAPSRGLLSPRPLEGVKYPTKIVDESDISESTLWHENTGRTRSSSNKSQFYGKVPNPGLTNSDRRTGWARGRGNFNRFTTQPQTTTYTDVRKDWHGRQNNFVNPSTEGPSPKYKPPFSPGGSVPYRGAGVGWVRDRGSQCSSRGDLWRQNEFPVHTSTRSDSNVTGQWGSRESSGPAWRSNIGRYQRMSALRISRSDQEEELLQKSKAHSEAQLEQSSWWRSDGPAKS